MVSIQSKPLDVKAELFFVESLSSESDDMTQIIYVSRLNPKTTEQDFERFCTRFGNVVECVIYPENDKLSKRSGYAKFASCHSAEKMYRQSCEETFYIDQTSIDVELRRGNSQPLNEKTKQKANHASTIYTVNIEGQITDEKELINYLNSKPLGIIFNEMTNDLGQVIKIGAQVTFNDKDLVDRILKQNHEKYTMKLVSNPAPMKREHEQEQSIDVKRSKLSPNPYSSITSHLESITQLTHDMHEENERLKTDKSLLTITLNQQITKIKQIESEKSDLIESLSKTHDIAKCLTNKFKLREDEHKQRLEESNKKISEFDVITKTANEALLKAINEIQRLTNHITTLENHVEELNTKHTQSETIYLAQQRDIEHFFSALKKNLN